VVKRLAVLIGVVATAVVASMVSAPKADALLGLLCPAKTIEHPFAAFGDSNAYTLISSAETSSGWSLKGGSVASGNEPWFVHSSADSRGVSIAPGGKAETPAVCLTLLDPTARYFTRGSAGGKLQVDVIGKLPLGLGLVLGSTTITGNGSWEPSDIQHFLANLTSVITWNLSLRFTAVSGTWQVDDVYLDPMLQR
jgi:hypothetical protein